MDFLHPPNYANLKRKRSAPSLGNTPPSSQLPPDAINPRSHPPNALKQLAVGGLSPADPLPSSTTPGFPHRPAPDAVATSHGDNHHSTATATGTHSLRAQERNIGVLVALVERCLSEGDVPRAKRAFALLLRADVDGRPVDLRHNQYWALGAEILMRDGEGARPRQGGVDEGHHLKQKEDEGEDETAADLAPVRWGSAANALRVRAYYEGLIKQFPYSRQWPRSVSALTFWPVMVGVDMYNVYIEERLAMQRIETEAWKKRKARRMRRSLWTTVRREQG